MAKILDYEHEKDEIVYREVCEEIDIFINEVALCDAGLADYMRKHTIRDPVAHTLMWSTEVPGEPLNPKYEELLKIIMKRK